jgi:hypothetical protein
MPEADPPRPNEDRHVLREALDLLSEEIRLQKELMKLQNAQLGECRQQLQARADELHQARQEAALHLKVLERRTEESRQEAARQQSQFEQQLNEVRQEAARRQSQLERELDEVRQGLQNQLAQRTEELRLSYNALGQAQYDLSQARRELSTRFWRYTRPVRGFLGLFDPKG